MANKDLMPTLQGVQYPHNLKVYNLCRMKLFGIEKWTDEVAETRKRYYEGKFVVGRGHVLEKLQYKQPKIRRI